LFRVDRAWEDEGAEQGEIGVRRLGDNQEDQGRIEDPRDSQWEYIFV